jgi:hypothetical protein
MDGTVTLQDRIERSPFGRGMLSTLIVFTLAAIAVVNLPNSYLRTKVLQGTGPYLNATGLDQNWLLFAPNPRGYSIAVSALVSLAGGRVEVWRPPMNGPLVGAYRDYRWRKWEENVADPANGAELWRPAALWAAGHVPTAGRTVTKVRLIERFAAINPPGTTPSTGPEQQKTLYTLKLLRP